MNTKCAIAATLVVSSAFSSAYAADGLEMPSAPPWIVNIPSDAHREVLGVWNLERFGCSRSIEVVLGEPVLVSWCPPSEKRSTGIPLRKDPANPMRFVHRFIPATVYEISPDGYLVMSSDGRLFAVGVPASGVRGRDK